MKNSSWKKLACKQVHNGADSCWNTSISEKLSDEAAKQESEPAPSDLYKLIPSDQLFITDNYELLIKKSKFEFDSWNIGISNSLIMADNTITYKQ